MSPLSGQAITLANSIIGVGILAMPYCFKQCGIILSIIILIGSGIVSRLACHFLMKSAIYARRDNFESLAYHVFGSAGKFTAEIGIIGFLMGTCVAYFVVVGDLGPQIIAKMFNLNQSDFLRTSVMVIVSLVCVLPLGLLRNVDSLSNVCAATIGFYFCLVLKILLEAANPLLSGHWVSKVVYWRPEGVLQCLPIFSMALCCQTQLFEIYDTLPNATLDKMNAITKNAVNICTVVYIFVGLFGYIAFCHLPISGNILVSFSPTMGSDVIQIGFVMSLAFSFPLIIFPCRASLYSLLYRKGQSHNQELINNLIPKMRFKCLTVTIIVVTLIVGVMLPNIELVLGLVGSTIGIMICVIFPSTCFICISVKNTNERILAQIILCFGIILMVLGTYANLQAIEMDKIGLESKIALEMDRYSQSNQIDKIPPTNLVLDVNKDIVDSFSKKSIEKPKVYPSKETKVVPVESLDSKIQPPNPVPPQEDNNVKSNLLSPVMDKLDSESITKYEKLEGAEEKEIQAEVDEKEKLVPSIIKLTTSSPDIKETNVDKEAALMKTIEKHLKVQQQMVEEQKEILEEIKEMKKDIESKQKEEAIKSKMTNQKTVDKIKKLAQAAIESLQENTDSSMLKQTVEKKDREEKIVKESVPNKNNKIVEEIGQDSSKSNAIKKDLKVNKKALPANVNVSQKKSMSEEVPIALALSKGKKDEAKNQNEVLRDLSKEAVHEVKKIDRVKKELPPKDPIKENINVKDEIKVVEKESSNYAAGKRDILGVQTDSVVTNTEAIPVRNKRDIHNVESNVSCVKESVANENTNHNLYSQFNSANQQHRTFNLKTTKIKR